MRVDQAVAVRLMALVVAGLAGAAGMAGAQGLPVRIPAQAFGELPHPPPPDYSKPQYWAALPDRLDAADAVPENDPFGDRQATAPVDVFFLHPTTYREIDYWNAPLDDAGTNAWTDESVIARQASVFNACCRVFAPRYRQASSAGVYAPPEKRPQEAYRFAYGDARAAFLHYMKHWNKGRPFIIAGHSQGAGLTQFWLEEFGADPKLRRQLVAVYPIGIPFGEGALARLPGGGLRVCGNPTDTGCLVTWNAFDRGGDPSGWRKSAQQRYEQRYGTTAGSAIVCVNPLTFDLAKPVAPAAWNLGALPARPGVGRADGLSGQGVAGARAFPATGAADRSRLALPPTEAGGIGASCEDGVLLVDAPPRQGYAIVPLPAGMLHFNDFDLFYQSIRVNAVARSEAFVSARHAGR
jgi:hypothetical protein